jgi:ribosomal protein S18 acetylase RimI-like enzyme
VFEQMASFHPQEPHWYLPLIGVDPARQGQHLGDRLMAHALARCDADGLPAYLESSNPRNISFYQRHGFVELGKIQAGSSPTIVPMLRRPRVAR